MVPRTFDRRGHLWVAALLWTVVGALLTANGARLWFASDPFGERPWLGWLLVLAAVAVGLGKGALVLDRSAAQVIGRAPDAPAQRPLRSLYHLFGPRLLLLMAIMCLLGMALRLAPVAPAPRGWVLLAIGVALLWSSRRYWSALRRAEPAAPSPFTVPEEDG